MSDALDGGGCEYVGQGSHGKHLSSSQLSSLKKKSVGLLCILNESTMHNFLHPFDHLENIGSEADLANVNTFQCRI